MLSASGFDLLRYDERLIHSPHLALSADWPVVATSSFNVLTFQLLRTIDNPSHEVLFMIPMRIDVIVRQKQLLFGKKIFWTKSRQRSRTKFLRDFIQNWFYERSQRRIQDLPFFYFFIKWRVKKTQTTSSMFQNRNFAVMLATVTCYLFFYLE